MTPANPHFEAMSAYKLAQMSAPMGQRLISLAQNESLRAPSPRAIEAARKVIAEGALYPDPDWTELREALGEAHGVAPSMILCGSGSLDLIGCLARIYAGPERSIRAPAHSYPFFRSAAQMVGAPYREAPVKDLTTNTEALLASVSEDTSIVFVANPGNPTGTRISNAALRDLRSRLPDSVLLVIDEAYGEFPQTGDAPCFDMAAHSNTVILRTFSKAYAMAGFRVGWGVFPEGVVEDMRKALNPNNVSAASQAAAVAAVVDAAYMQETCALTIELREAAAQRLSNAGFSVLPSSTNFLLLDCGSQDRASALAARLETDGIFLRGQAGAGLPGHLRMTIGPEADTDHAVTALIKASSEYTP